MNLEHPRADPTLTRNLINGIVTRSRFHHQNGIFRERKPYTVLLRLTVRVVTSRIFEARRVVVSVFPAWRQDLDPRTNKPGFVCPRYEARNYENHLDANFRILHFDYGDLLGRASSDYAWNG